MGQISRILLLTFLAATAPLAKANRVVDFESGGWGNFLEFTGTGSGVLTEEQSMVIAGKKSLLIDTRSATGEWNVVVRTKEGLFQPETRYTVRLKCRVLELSPGKTHFYFLTRPLGTNAWSPIIPEEEVGAVKEKEYAFLAGPRSDISLQLGIRGKGLVVVDSLEIEDQPRLTAAQLATPGVGFKRAEPYEPVGICLHADRVSATPFGYTDALLDRALDMWKDLGVQWVRISLGKPFATREAAMKGEADPVQKARTEKLMAGLRARHIKFYIITSAGHVPWFAQPAGQANGDYPLWAYPSTQEGDYQVLIEALAKQWGKDSDFWEIGNEMDWEFWAGSPELYMKNLSLARATLKKSNPRVKIIMGGLAGDGIVGLKKGKDRFLQTLYDLGLKNQTDILAFHLYLDTVEKNIYQLNRSVGVMAKNGDGAKPIWITETSKCNLQWQTGGKWVGTPELEQGQADYLRETYSILLRHPNVEKVFWWNFKALKALPDRETGLALVGTNLEPRPAYETLKKMVKPTQSLANPDFLSIDGLGR